MMKNTNNHENAIEFNQVSKKFGDLVALDSASFKIKPGSIFGYIGPNGAGKTTTMKILVGLIPEFSGVVKINGSSIAGDKNLLYTSLGYMPQEADFQEWRTVYQALWTFGLLSGVKSSDLATKISQTLTLVGLNGVEDKKIKYLSGGMKQKLKLAQALLHNPDLVILDEPMNGLDPASRYHLKNIIKQKSKEGITIIFSSHILSDVQDIADEIGIINHGKILRIGSPKQLQQEFKIGNVIELETEDTLGLQIDLTVIQSINKIEKLGETKMSIVLKPSVDIDQGMYEILNFLMKNKIKIRTFKLAQPSLEDVYLKFVGGDSA